MIYKAIQKLNQTGASLECLFCGFAIYPGYYFFQVEGKKRKKGKKFQGPVCSCCAQYSSQITLKEAWENSDQRF